MRLQPVLAACAALLCLTAPLAPASAQVTRIATINDHSGTITAANVSQTAIPQSTTGQRGWLMCQNPITATTTLFVNFGTSASTAGGSIELAPGGSIAFVGLAVPLTSVSVASATAGARFICKTGNF